MSTNDQNRTYLHPASGAIILALDWLLFSGTALSLGLSTPALSVLGFVLGSLSTTWIQRRYGHDMKGPSWMKGLLAGVAVGIPLPIAGTAVGAWVLSLSGLNRWKQLRRPDREPNSSSDTE